MVKSSVFSVDIPGVTLEVRGKEGAREKERGETEAGGDERGRRIAAEFLQLAFEDSGEKKATCIFFPSLSNSSETAAIVLSALLFEIRSCLLFISVCPQGKEQKRAEAERRGEREEKRAH